MIRITLLLILISLAVPVWAECDNPALVVDELAEDTTYRDCWQVQYVVWEAYPAESLIQRILKQLHDQGWRKIDFDPVEPSASDPPVHQWSESGFDNMLDQWLGWFIRDDQSRLQLHLLHPGRVAPESGQGVIVTITFVPREQWETRPR